jgi:hypothetical protein
MVPLGVDRWGFFGVVIEQFLHFFVGDKKLSKGGICATDISVVKRLLGCMSLGRGGEVFDSCCLLLLLAYSDSTRPAAAAQIWGERFGRHGTHTASGNIHASAVQ